MSTARHTYIHTRNTEPTIILCMRTQPVAITPFITPLRHVSYEFHCCKSTVWLNNSIDVELEYNLYREYFNVLQFNTNTNSITLFIIITWCLAILIHSSAQLGDELRNAQTVNVFIPVDESGQFVEFKNIRNNIASVWYTRIGNTNRYVVFVICILHSFLVECYMGEWP